MLIGNFRSMLASLNGAKLYTNFCAVFVVVGIMGNHRERVEEPFLEFVENVS